MIQNVSCQVFHMVVYLTLNRLMHLLLALDMMMIIEVVSLDPDPLPT